MTAIPSNPMTGGPRRKDGEVASLLTVLGDATHSMSTTKGQEPNQTS